MQVDWEHPSDPAQGQNYILLLSALRSALPPPQYLLTSALPCGEWALRNIPLAQTAPLLDLVNLMAYDFSGPWTKVAGHHAQLRAPLLYLPPGSEQEAASAFRRNSAQAGVAYLLAHGVHPCRIALGVPAYARCFRGARAPGDAYSAAEACDYRDLPPDRAADAAVFVDLEAGAACYVDEAEGGRGFVSLDTPRTVRLKARYVRANALAGLFYWQGVGDVNTPGRSLVAAGFEALAAPGED